MPYFDNCTSVGSYRAAYADRKSNREPAASGVIDDPAQYGHLLDVFGLDRDPVCEYHNHMGEYA